MMNKKHLIIQIILFVLYLGMLIFFIYECFQNGNEAGRQAGWVSDTIAKILSKISGKEIVVDTHFKTLVSKLVGHYGYFCILGLISILFYMTFNKLKVYIRFLIHLSVGIAFALISEFLAEAITSGRNASIIDVLIDVGGLLTLSSIYILIYYLVNKQKEKKDI